MSGKHRLPPSPRPGARPFVRVLPPDSIAADAEFGFTWAPGADDELWDAHEALVQHNDARPLVRALLGRGLLPDAVREGFALWLAGKLPPEPVLSVSDWHLWQAAQEYRDTDFRLNKRGARCETAKQKAERVAADYSKRVRHTVEPGPMLKVARCEGERYQRIRDFLRGAHADSKRWGAAGPRPPAVHFRR
jgi:hypothetical protein